MVEIQKEKNNRILLFLMAVMLAILFVYSPLTIITKADSNRVTSVIEDLQTDPNFKVEDYPNNSEDYSLKVIQIAETTAKELLIYVYQPSAVTLELRAESINISTSIGENFAPKNYKLTFLNYRGVFQKYVVNDFYVKNDALRYYDIISIFRKWNEDIDDKAGGDNTISERSYEVGQQWTACTVNGHVSYTYETIETIEITDKFVGFTRYYTNVVGSFLGFLNSQWDFNSCETGCDMHFVAFSTDKKIDKLLEAKITFNKQNAEYYKDVNVKKFRNIQTELNRTLKYTEQIEFNDIRNYSWPEIQTVEEFISNETFERTYEHGIFNETITSNLKKVALNNISNKQFVLRFEATPYESSKKHLETWSGPVSTPCDSYSIVSDVTILELTFENEGITYNLGVVDNKQTGSGKPVNDITITNEINGDYIKMIMDLLLKVVLIVIGIACLPVIVTLLPIILKIIFLPFSIIKNILKGSR